MEGRARRCRETSPDRAKACATANQRRVKPISGTSSFRKVQVVYYLSRNGHLEHPHYMEVTHLPHQPLRLKDVTDRLTVLRGQGMPSLYSWSCKRSYKNGYVWNDLAENDAIYPSDGAEYVLKGSELIQGCTENFQQIQVRNRSQQLPGPIFHPKSMPLAPKRHSGLEEVENCQYEDNVVENEDDEGEEEEDKTSYTSSMTPLYSRCSRGVSTDDAELEKEQSRDSAHKNNPSTELTLGNSPPPSTTSSTISDKANESTNTSKRFEDGDPLTSDSALGRNSVLLQLISCGGSSSFRAKTESQAVKPQPSASTVARNSASSLHRGVVCKSAAAAAKVVAEEEEQMIRCMSENPRFGNMQAEEKEYFSGSIVESTADGKVEVEAAAGLKRSSSYNEERSCQGGLAREAVEEEPRREKASAMKGKCIPRKKSSSKQTQK
ncbi:hypothetical protein NMG60_11007282 [Bertholletia excelsa]